MEDNLNPRQMEDELIFFKNRRRHQKFQKWKTTSKISKMQEDLNFLKMEDKKKSFLDFSKI